MMVSNFKGVQFDLKEVQFESERLQLEVVTLV